MSKRGRPRKTSTLPQRWESLSVTHEAAGALLRQICVAQLEQLQTQIEQGETVYHGQIRALGETLVRAITIEREALDMDLNRDSRAIDRVVQLGFLVSAPDGAIEVEAKYVQ